jgi:tetratricopeptide (TPR) repeat protein
MRPEPRIVPGLAEALPELLSSLERDGTLRNFLRVAEAHWLAGDPLTAISLLEPMAAGGKAGVAVHLLLGWCYEDAGMAGAAKESLAEAERLEPENRYARSEDTAADESGSEPESGPEIDGETQAEPERELTPEELQEVPPEPLYSATLGQIFERQGFEEKALEIYREVVRVHPEREDLRQRIDDLVRREDEGEFGE